MSSLNKKRTDNWLSLNKLQLPLGENRYRYFQQCITKPSSHGSGVRQGGYTV